LVHAEQEGASQRRFSPRALIIAAAVIVVDQITKVLVLDHLGPGPHHVIGPFGFMLTSNTGSAFSLFQGSTGILAAVDVVVVCLLAVVAVRARSWPLQIGLGLMLGGAIGNLVDRVAHHSRDGGVVDFITFPHFATFNAADASITIGVIVVLGSLVFDLVAERRTKGAPRA
jgi:signal peptidase II